MTDQNISGNLCYFIYNEEIIIPVQNLLKLKYICIHTYNTLYLCEKIFCISCTKICLNQMSLFLIVLLFFFF